MVAKRMIKSTAIVKPPDEGVDAERVSVRAIQTTRWTVNVNKSSFADPLRFACRSLSIKDARRLGAGQYSPQGARSLGVELPLLLQSSIALCTGMVAATFIPPIRKVIPRPVEVILWSALIGACAIGLMGITDEGARNLTTSVFWATDKLVSTVVGLLLSGIGGWISANRLAIATWLISGAGAGLFALIVLRSVRARRERQPRVRLREWMEMPVAAPQRPARARGRSPLVDINRRLAASSIVLGAAVLGWTVDLSIWIRNVMLPREARRLALAAQAGRVGSRARLESWRDATAHLQYAARAWYAAAGEPAVNGLAVKATRAARRGLRPVALRPGQVIDIQALLSAQSIGWYGPLNAGPTQPPRGEHDATEPPQTDRLAS